MLDEDGEPNTHKLIFKFKTGVELPTEVVKKKEFLNAIKGLENFKAKLYDFQADEPAILYNKLANRKRGVRDGA